MLYNQTSRLDLEIPTGREVRIAFLPEGSLPHDWKWALQMPGGEQIPHAVFVGSGAFPSRPDSNPTLILPFGEYSIAIDIGDDRQVSVPFRVELGEGTQDVKVVLSTEEA